MKGGIAAMTVAAEALAGLGVLAGDLIVATNTDEESSGAGGVALVAARPAGGRCDRDRAHGPRRVDVLSRLELRRDHRPGPRRPRRDRPPVLARRAAR